MGPDWFIDVIWDFAKENGSSLVMAYLVYAAFLVMAAGFCMNTYPYKEYLVIPRWRNSIAAIVILPIISIAAFFYEDAAWEQKGIVILFLLLAELYIIWNLWKRRSAERIKMDQCFEEEQDFLKVYRGLEEIDEGKLTPKEKKLLKKRKYYILYELGSMKRADSLMREVEEEDSPEYNMFLAIEQEKAGNVEKAEEYMQKAWSRIGNTEREHHTRVQVLNDYGRCYRISGNFREAVTYYKQAVDELRFPEDEKLAEPIYTNYIFTLCMLNPPEWDKAQEMLEQYKYHLNMNTMKGRLTYQNLQLEILRQMNQMEECKKLIDSSFYSIMDMNLTETERLVYEATHLRVAHTAGGNFIAPLEAIHKDLDKFQKLAMPRRYRAIKEIHILFRQESPAAPAAADLYKDVAEFAHKYIAKQARKDIEEYLDGLPADAVYLRADLTQELVGISHYEEKASDKNDSFEKNKELMLSIRNIYESNGLLLNAMKTSLNLADECFFIENLDEEYMPKHMEVLREALSYGERILEKVLLHPDCAEDFARLAWMYIRIHQYEKCEKYIALHNKCNLSPAHYAPWHRKILWAVELMKRVLELEKRIETIQKNPQKMQELSLEAREWLKHYPQYVDSMECTLLWGGLLGQEQVFAKRRIWYGMNEQTGEVCAKVHHWLCIQEFYETSHITVTVLEIDMKYRFLEQCGVPKTMFLADMHPLQSGKAVLLQQDVEKTNMPAQNVQGGVFWFPHADEAGRKTKLEELREYISGEKYVPL